MIDSVLQAAKSDARLAALIDETREYAQVYLRAKNRGTRTVRGRENL